MTRWILFLTALAWSAMCSAQEPVLLDFYADWCTPCQQLAPSIAALEREGYAVQRVNVDVDVATAKQYGVKSIPTVVVTVGDQERERVSGVASTDHLRRLVAKHRQPAIARPAQPPAKTGPQPRPAWRYEHPTGFRSSVVRIMCQLDRGKCYGSGVLVRWRGQVVVLTARHVVDGAKSVTVTVTSTGKTHSARVLKTDHSWDCAVLYLDQPPQGVQIAELAFGNNATLQAGARLESLGYGPDGKMAANGGLFVGYRRSTATPQDGPDDWFILSGYARQGDSGGPVFNAQGQVIGVLWGCSPVDAQVVCVQAGRIHALLDVAIPLYQQRAYFQPCQYMVPVVRERRPTPPAQSDGCPPGGCPSIGGQSVPLPIPGPVEVDQSAAVDGAVRRHLLPFRNEITQQQADTNRRLDGLQQQVGGLVEAINRQAQAPQAQPPVSPANEAPKEDAGPKTVVGKIADKEAQWLAEHGGPISKRLAAKAEDNLDDDNAAVRFKGFTQAKVAMLVFCGGILFILGFGVFVLHKLNNKMIPVLKNLAARTPTTLDDRLVERLSSVHDRVGALGTRLKGRIQDRFSPDVEDDGTSGQ